MPVGNSPFLIRWFVKVVVKGRKRAKLDGIDFHRIPDLSFKSFEIKFFPFPPSFQFLNSDAV